MRILKLLCFYAAIWGQEMPNVFTPRLAVAFGGLNKVEAEKKAVLITDNKGQMPPIFSCGFSGEIISNNIRLGGGMFGIKGEFFDSETGGIFYVGGGTGDLQSAKFSFEKFPPGIYSLILSVHGKTPYSRRISLPMDEKSRNSFNVNLEENKEFSGKVQGIPKFSLDSPIIGVGESYFSALEDDNFKFSARVSSDELITIICRFSNPLYGKEWGTPLYYYIFKFPQEEVGLLKIPDVGDWKCAVGNVNFDEYLSKYSLDSIRDKLLIKVSSQDDRITFQGTSDKDGKFMVIGLPDGKYKISIEVLGNPPFCSDPLQISIVDHRAENFNIILHSFK